MVTVFIKPELILYDSLTVVVAMTVVVLIQQSGCYCKIVGVNKAELTLLCDSGCAGRHGGWDLCQGEGGDPRPVGSHHLGSSQGEAVSCGTGLCGCPSPIAVTMWTSPCRPFLHSVVHRQCQTRDGDCRGQCTQAGQVHALCVDVWEWIPLCMCLRMCVCVYVFEHAHVCAYMGRWEESMCLCMREGAGVYAVVCVCVCMCVCVCVCVPTWKQEHASNCGWADGGRWAPSTSMPGQQVLPSFSNDTLPCCPVYLA